LLVVDIKGSVSNQTLFLL